MRLATEKKQWFTYPEDPDNAEFEIKDLRAGELNRIIDSAFVQKFEIENSEGDQEPTLRPSIEIKRVQETEMIVIASISNWKNVFDKDGNPVECTTKNKELLVCGMSEKEYPEFKDFILACRKEL
jgi:hypothetical protein